MTRARALRTPRAARSFTFSVDKKAGRLERLSSVTGGYHQDWTDRLTGYELIEAGWLTFLRENTKNMDGMWTSPFIDASGSGLIMSYAKPLYYGDKFLGVATKDINLATLEKKLLYGTWGTAYAFLTNREAETMVHPNLEPPSHISADPVFPDIGELETQGGAPAAFLTDVRAQLIAGASGSAAMDAIRLVPRGTALDGFDAVTDAVVYWWDVVPDSDFVVCYVLATPDDVHVRTPLSPREHEKGRASDRISSKRNRETLLSRALRDLGLRDKGTERAPRMHRARAPRHRRNKLTHTYTRQ